MKALLGVLFFFVFGSSALAERYIVVLKNKTTFNNVHSQITLAKTSRLESSSAFAAHPMAVEASLANLNTLVVSSTNIAAIRSLAANSEIAWIEKEKFYRSPAPVRGYKMTQAWDYRGPGGSRTRAAMTAGSNPVLGGKTPYGISLVKAPQAWAKGFQGQNVRVVILDTGIDKNHPALGAQIAATQDFVGDHNMPYDVADHVGHGSHVAGTIAGVPFADGFVGVAPKAQLMIGRVCSQEGCSTAAVVAGINWAISQKADVVNLSLGGKEGTQVEKLALAAAEKAGVVIVAASGNDGVGQVGFPAAFANVIAVGAVDSQARKAEFSQWGPELSVVGPGVDVTSSVPVGTGRDTLVVLSNQGVPKQVLASSFLGSPQVPSGLVGNLIDCGLGKPEELNAAKVSGKLALIKRGELKFLDKAKNAIAAGAKGVVFYNTEPGLVQGSITSDGSTLSIPVIMIEQINGEAVKRILAGGGMVEANLKTFPADYSMMSGTSMATPHVTGVVALIRSANRKLNPTQVREVLKTTCRALAPNTANEFGKGLVDSEAAVVKALSIH